MDDGFKTWTVQDARAHFGPVIDAALGGRPQRIARRGREAVIVVSEEEWRLLARPKPAMNLGEYLATYPLSPADIDLTEWRQREARLGKSFGEHLKAFPLSAEEWAEVAPKRHRPRKSSAGET